ncbi:MAG: Crp/Fnr family transcriptional regulator [Rhodothermales bacterium]
MAPDLDQLYAALERWVVPSDAARSAFAALFTIRDVETDALVSLPGTMQHELLFVCKGLLRFYYPGTDGKETNKAFIPADTFAGAYAASALGTPVLYGVQAMEPTRVLVANFAAVRALYDTHPSLDRFGRRLAEWMLMRKEARSRSLLQFNATDRYRQFVDEHPDLVQRVPQYHIASYLGVTEVTLSRLRRVMTTVSSEQD